MLKKIFSFFSNEWIFVITLSTLLIYVSFLPFLHQIAITPEDKVFMGTHNNALDYPVFISTIIQAERGKWTTLAKYTSEAQPGTLVHTIYIPLGKIGGLFNANPVFLYHLARIITAFGFSFSIYYFLQFVFKEAIKRKLAFFLILFSAGFTKMVFSPQGIKFLGPFLDWWTGGDVIRRSVFIPHGMAKNILLLLILVWMSKFLTKGKKIHLYLSLPATLLLGQLDPMNTLAILALLGLYSLYKIVELFVSPKDSQKAKFKPLIYQLSSIGLYFVISGISLLYTNWVFQNTPWKVVRLWESQQFYQINIWEYANHIGITFYLGIIGLVFLVKRYKNFGSLISIILTFASIFFLLTGVSKYVGLSTLRFFQIPVYIFLGIGSAELIITLLSKFPKKLTLPLIFLICTAVLLISSPTYYFSMKQQFDEFKTYYPNLYVDKNIYQSIVWLKDNVPVDTAVLSDYSAGTVIPGISGNNVYIGHPVSTINFSQKEAIANKFLSGTMNAQEAQKTLNDGRISYVLAYGTQRDNLNSKKYLFLKPIFQNSLVTIFRFVP